MEVLCIYNNLRSYRVKKGLSQTELGKLSGLSQVSISSIEKGLWTPSVKHALYLSYVLECKVEDLFFCNDPFIFCKIDD